MTNENNVTAFMVEPLFFCAHSLIIARLHGNNNQNQICDSYFVSHCHHYNQIKLRLWTFALFFYFCYQAPTINEQKVVSIMLFSYNCCYEYLSQVHLPLKRTTKGGTLSKKTGNGQCIQIVKRKKKKTEKAPTA